jgi:hypothetical protein
VYLTRELASLRTAISEVATRDYVRGEIQEALEEILAELRGKSESDSN